MTINDALRARGALEAVLEAQAKLQGSAELLADLAGGCDLYDKALLIAAHCDRLAIALRVRARELASEPSLTGGER